MGVSGQRHAVATLPPGKRPGTQRLRGIPGPVWTGAENLVLTGIRARTAKHVARRFKFKFKYQHLVIVYVHYV